MSLDYDETDASYVWRWATQDILTNGQDVAPRGQPTKEILHRTVVVNMRKPVVNVPARQLSYQFMAAEAYWILSGSNRVDDIAPYNRHISQFSDNGSTFFGAYGPKIRDQLTYVVFSLLKDKDTRQAGLTIWREKPQETKDVPCTISLFFNIRGDKLNCHAFMRSSDVWLGLPYDIFNFSMVAHYICGFINDRWRETLYPGSLYLTAMSSHLYLQNEEEAKAAYCGDVRGQLETPPLLFTDHNGLMKYLEELRNSKPGSKLRWWE